MYHLSVSEASVYLCRRLCGRSPGTCLLVDWTDRTLGPRYTTLLFNSVALIFLSLCVSFFLSLSFSFALYIFLSFFLSLSLFLFHFLDFSSSHFLSVIFSVCLTCLFNSVALIYLSFLALSLSPRKNDALQGS